MRTKSVRILALALAMAFTLGTTALATVNESYTIASKWGSLEPTGNGGMEIWFSVTGTGAMKDIGAHSISLYKANGDFVVSFSPTQNGYENMMSGDTGTYSSYVTYHGVAGERYYAVITFYAENYDGVGEYRSYTTTTETV